MASVEITISGVLYDKYNRSQQNVVLIGEASLTGLQVGGGPMPPGQGGGQPPGIWGPGDPRPQPPINLPPGVGSGNPPGIWGGGNVPMPSPPIANVPGLPPMPDLPPNLPPVDGEDRPIDWKSAWTPETGWIVIGIPNVPHPTPSQ